MSYRSVCSGWGPWLAIAVTVVESARALAAQPTSVPATPAAPIPAVAATPIPIFSASLSVASGNLSVPVPCLGASTPNAATVPANPLRTCSDVIDGESSIPRPGYSPAPGLTTILYSRINQQVSCAYQGPNYVDYDPSQATAAGQCAGQTLGHPCSLIGHPFNNWTSETTQDFNGVACDSHYMSISVNHGHCSLPQTSAAPTAAEETQLAQILASQYGISDSSQLDALAASDPAKAESIMAAISAKYPDLVSATQSSSSSGGGQSNCVYFSATKPNGERERTWARGAWLQAMSYYTQQVLNEITCAHSLQVNADPFADGCAVFAQDAITQYNNAITASKNVATLGGASAVADIDYCKADWSAPNAAGQTDPGRLRQASQHLCAARSHLETVFAHLASCEILQRTRANFDKNIGLHEATRQANFINNIINGNAMRAQCDSCRKSSSYGQATSCMNSCYQKNIGQDYQQYLQNLWNLNQPASCPNPVPGGKPYNFPNQKSSSSNFFGFAILVGSLSRRSRRPKKKSGRAIAACIGLTVLAILAGCSKAQNLPSVPTTSSSNSTCPGGDPACCGSSPPSSCPTENAGGGAQSSTGSSGAAEIANTGTEVGLAQNLASGASGSTNGYSAEGSASTTASSGSTTTPGASSGSAASLPSVMSGASGSGSSGSGSSGGGSALGSSADVATAAASPTPAGLSPNPNASGSAANAASTYGSGGGGAPSAKSASGGGFLYGNGLMGGAGAAGSDVGFGNTAGASAMNGTDPEDYFQRIAVEGDLFKQVENRYRETSANWAAAGAAANAPAMSDAGAASTSIHPQPQK